MYLFLHFFLIISYTKNNSWIQYPKGFDLMLPIRVLLLTGSIFIFLLLYIRKLELTGNDFLICSSALLDPFARRPQAKWPEQTLPFTQLEYPTYIVYLEQSSENRSSYPNRNDQYSLSDVVYLVDLIVLNILVSYMKLYEFKQKISISFNIYNFLHGWVFQIVSLYILQHLVKSSESVSCGSDNFPQN